MTRGTVLLWIGALVVSAFTLDRILDPFDEGLVLQAGARIAAGQWPYADFAWSYGPGHALLQGAWSALFAPSVVPWRVVRAVGDATVAVLAATLALPAGRRWAWAAGVTTALIVAQPTSANPSAPAFALALGAVLAAVRGRVVAAGALVALVAFWRPDFGAAALAAVVAALLAYGDPRPPWVRAVARAPGARPAARAAAVAVALGAALYAPFVAVAGIGAVWDALVATSFRDSAAWRLPFPLVYDGPLRMSSLRVLAQDGKDLVGFYVPLAAVLGLAVAAVVGAAWLARAARSGRARAAATAGDAGATVERHRALASGPAGALGAGGALASAPASAWGAAAELRGALAGVLVLGAGALAYLLGRADDLHQQPLAVTAVVALALATAVPGPAAAPRRVVATALVALLLVAGAANRLSALVLPPDLVAVHLPGVPGIRVPPAEAAALPRVVRRVQRLVPPGEPIYVAPRRADLVTLSDPLLYALVRRPNVLDRDVVLQARPGEQRRIVGALRRARPRVVVRWVDPASSRPEPNERGRPTGVRLLDRYLARAYRRDARFGAYVILRRR